MGYDLFIIVTLPLLWLVLNVFSFVTIFLYQLGHAIPALLFTKKPVAVYVGTYGDNNCKKLTTGRLKIFVKPKFAYLKQNGICIYDTHMPFACQTATVIGGPVIAIAMICMLTTCTFFIDFNTNVRILCGFALMVSVLNLVINLFPRKLLVKSSERLYYSVGYQLILMLENKRNYSSIIGAYRSYDNGDHQIALNQLLTIDKQYVEDSLYSLMLSCCIHLNKFNKALDLKEEYAGAKWQESVMANDHYLLGYAAMKLKLYKEALMDFDRAININKNHFNSHNSRAFVYNAINDYATAREEATKAIFIQENSSEAYSTRAYANLMMSKTGEAISDAEMALTLDACNAYAHLVTGIYLQQKNKTEKSRLSFEQAKRLNHDMLYVDELLASVKQNV